MKYMYYKTHVHVKKKMGVGKGKLEDLNVRKRIPSRRTGSLAKFPPGKPRGYLMDGLVKNTKREVGNLNRLKNRVSMRMRILGRQKGRCQGEEIRER